MVLFFLRAPLAIGAQSPAAAGANPPPTDSIDLVLLMDDSASVLEWSKDVTDYLLGPFVRDYLRLGDTVHLLSFGSSMSLDTVRGVSGEADVKAILGQLFLLYPIQRHTDFIAALDQLTAYVRDLGSSRKKLIVIVSDGVQDPPPGSPWASLDAAGVKREIDRAASSLRSLGWPVRFVMLPFGNDSAAGTAAGTAAGAVATVGAATAGSSTSGSQPTPIGSGSTGPEASGTATGSGSTTAVPTQGSIAAAAPGARTQTAATSSGQAKAASVAGTGIAAADEAAKALDAQVTPWPPAESATPASSPGAKGQASSPSQAGATPGQASPASPSPRVDTAADFGIPSINFPADLGKRGRDFTLPLVIVNSSSKPLTLSLLSISAGGRELLFRPAKATIEAGARATLRPRIRLPADVAAGRIELPITFAFDDGVRTLPPDGILRLTLVETPLSQLLASPALLAILGLIVFFVVALGALRLLGWLPFRARDKVGKAMGRIASIEARPTAPSAIGSATRDAKKSLPPSAAATTKTLGPAAGAALGDAAALVPPAVGTAKPAPAPLARRSPAPAEPVPESRVAEAMATLPEKSEGPIAFESYSASVRRQGRIQVEMRVLEQNSHIGRRNVHELHAGQAKSIGGKHSDYLIFLVPMPHSVAELHFDGETCIFAPKDRRLFPDLEGPVTDCLDKDIPMLSPRSFPLTLRFTRWEDPSIKINRLLHCIEVPGIFLDRIADADGRGAETTATS
ncbi:MAG TPA: hypothetical protein VMV44_03730 [Rectinemataceae bacterium]|nr:hypothetical protein [Rectinemataceae bacterium]